MMDYQALHDDLARVLEDLIEKNHTVPVLVEGERDVRALRALGVSGDLRVVNRGTTLFAVCEEVAREHGDAIILTDWDVRGGRLARQLRDGLSANGVRYDDDLRARLTRLCRKEITAVEELRSFVERVSELAATGTSGKPSKRWYGERVRR
uniref:Uncharacterized protein n=1 Tax=uncultured euryarchaeote Rifle_16ft_4_minimus_37664 TaxID=1665194 RepID=A0A0H4TPK6_9EURY|nr:hypothetical protein [uncultured euryarchaeote Rifle_16ft_4_minimus_37664]